MSAFAASAALPVAVLQKAGNQFPRSLVQDQGANAYVLDIRNNGGGVFPAGVAVARMWLQVRPLIPPCDQNNECGL